MVRAAVTLEVPEVVAVLLRLGDPGRPIIHRRASTVQYLSLVIFGGKGHEDFVLVLDGLDDFCVVVQQAEPSLSLEVRVPQSTSWVSFFVVHRAFLGLPGWVRRDTRLQLPVQGVSASISDLKNAGGCGRSDASVTDSLHLVPPHP